MIRLQVFVYAAFAAVMAAPAMAHVDQSVHVHPDEFNWLAASLATASVVTLAVLRYREAVSRS